MIRTGSWKIGFYNVGHEPMIGDVFGCATLGAVAPNKVIEPDEDGLFIWKENVAGTVVSGTYDEVKREIGELYAKSGVCLIFLAAGQGAETLISRIREVFPGISVAGGVAANNGGKGKLSPRAEDAVILFPEENIYDAFSDNILKDTGIRFVLSTGIHPRHISALNGLDALADWRMLQSKYGIDETNFERMTLSDIDDVNVHMNAGGGTLNSGANCIDGTEYKLRYSSQKDLDDGAARFCDRENALIIGCAGLKSAMSRLPQAGDRSLVLFLFGEIAKDRFANLMMTGISRNAV